MVTLAWIFIIGLLFLIIYFPKTKTLHQAQEEERIRGMVVFQDGQSDVVEDEENLDAIKMAVEANTAKIILKEEVK